MSISSRQSRSEVGAVGDNSGELRFRGTASGLLLGKRIPGSMDPTAGPTSTHPNDSTNNAKGGFCDRCCAIFGFQPNRMVIDYLNWSFRSSFGIVFLSAALSFFAFTMLFALLIYLSGLHYPTCIYVNGIEFGQSENKFTDAYALSWTTFSTVGYGLIFPATSATIQGSKHDILHCTGITVLTTMESFVGILFSSICCAIVFAKVTRVASHAQVIFSDAMVIRYGRGIPVKDDASQRLLVPSDSPNSATTTTAAVTATGNVTTASSTDHHHHRHHHFQLSKIPCPLLEFRVINRLHGIKGGEIIDATMNIVATVHEKQAYRSVGTREKTAVARRRGKKGRRRGPHRGSSETDIGASPMLSHHNRKRLEKAEENVKAMLQAAARERQLGYDDTDNGDDTLDISVHCKAVPRFVFCKLEIESPEHPFFNRVWLARHVLNHNSPLVKPAARDLIRLHNGHWPPMLNNAEHVRASVKFDQILVSLSGTSNIDANSVYKQKTYEYIDVAVGYRFANVLYHDDKYGLGVDVTKLNDVTEQAGGGGENLTDLQLKFVEPV